MKKETLRKKLHEVIDLTEDSELLSDVKFIFEEAAAAKRNETLKLTAAQKKELDRRKEMIISGKERWYSQEEFMQMTNEARKKL